MRTLIIVMSLMFLPTAVFSDSGVYRDKFGNQTGSWSDSGGQRTYRDSSGNTVGTSSRDNDRSDYRDSSGNYQGSRDSDRRGRDD